MSKPVITMDIRTSLTDAAEKMYTHKIRRIVVLDKNKIVGIITSRDILKAVLREPKVSAAIRDEKLKTEKADKSAEFWRGYNAAIKDVKEYIR
jgi:CBS domain-containing protein